jgi:hypothetical protein
MRALNESEDAPDLANRLLERYERGGVPLGHRPSPDRVSISIPTMISLTGWRNLESN